MSESRSFALKALPYDFSNWQIGDWDENQTLRGFVVQNLRGFQDNLVAQIGSSYGESTLEDDLAIEIVLEEGNGERVLASSMKTLIDDVVEFTIEEKSGSYGLAKAMFAISDYLKQQAERLKIEAPDPAPNASAPSRAR